MLSAPKRFWLDIYDVVPIRRPSIDRILKLYQIPESKERGKIKICKSPLAVDYRGKMVRYTENQQAETDIQNHQKEETQ